MALDITLTRGDPSHVVLRLTRGWVWQRCLERFDTVVAAQQLDRSFIKLSADAHKSSYLQANCKC